MAYSNGYTYRKEITIDNTKVSGTGDLTNFPVLISHTDAALKTTGNGGKVQHASGYDIRFETTGGTQLDHEVVFWSATTGQIIAWVEIPTLDGDADTDIYIYYGNSSVSATEEDPTGVWDSNYKGTWHMIQDPSGSAPQLLDSTSNNYDMTTEGTMTSGDLVTGQIYKAIDFDGSNDAAKNTSWSSVIDENDAFTIEHWFNISSTPNSQFVAWGEAGASNLCSTGTYGNNIGFIGYANDHLVSAGPYDDGAWHHLAVTHNGTTVKVIIDGSEVKSESMTLGTNANQDLYFARWKDGGFYPAKLEEIRISNIARSNDWMITTYETAKNPGTFYSLGSEETAPSIALVAHSSVTNAQDTSGINTTGATLIVITMAGGNNITPSDNKGNTYTGLTIRSQGGDDVRLWYCLNPTVGTGHTFHQQWSYEALFAAAFSGVTAYDGQENGAAGDGTDTSLQPGSITPSENNCLLITGLMAGLTNSNHAVNGGFTITDSINGVNGVNYGGAMAYLIQTTAAAANPTHSWTSSVPAAVAMASFRGPGGGGGASTQGMLLMF